MSKDRFLDDLVRVAGGAVTLASGLQNQIRGEVKSRVQDFADQADLVPREDYEQLADTVLALQKRLGEIETELDTLKKSVSKTKTKKT